MHLPLPALILALAGTAQLIRIMRANLLDELRRPYVTTARARGLQEWRVIVKYPVRAALNPFASTIGYLLPFVVSGSIVVSLVLSLPTVGPVLLRALVAQDMFLAGAIVLLLGVHDRDRHLPLGSDADVDRSAHPGGAARHEHGHRGGAPGRRSSRPRRRSRSRPSCSSPGGASASTRSPW